MIIPSSIFKKGFKNDNLSTNLDNIFSIHSHLKLINLWLNSLLIIFRVSGHLRKDIDREILKGEMSSYRPPLLPRNTFFVYSAVLWCFLKEKIRATYDSDFVSGGFFLEKILVYKYFLFFVSHNFLCIGWEDDLIMTS